jgi:hypothetical protein
VRARNCRQDRITRLADRGMQTAFSTSNAKEIMETASGTSATERLRAAQSAVDVAAVLADPAAFAEIVSKPKEPAVRKAILLLATADQEDQVQSRVKRLALLAALAKDRTLSSIINEYARQALAAPLSDEASGLSQNEKLALAGWLEDQRAEWISHFALVSALSELQDEKVSVAFLQAFLTDTSVVADCVSSITEAIKHASRRLTPSEAGNLCRGLGKVVARTRAQPGRALGKNIKSLLIEHLINGDQGYQAAEKADLAGAVAELLVALVERFPSLLISQEPITVIGVLENGWISKTDRRWKAAKKTLLTELERSVALLAVAGVCQSETIRAAAVLENDLAVAQMCRVIAEQYDISSEAVLRCLTSPIEAANTPQRNSQTETEALASVMIRARELASEKAADNPVLTALITEIGQLAARSSLQLDSETGEVVAFDPIRQRVTRPIRSGGKVQIVTPGVVRTTDAGVVQIVPAIVEPAD